ncbi:MAG TPA: hypothetical protein VHB77_00045, partial [Planctomycetaceae bacterium]|nr:hypothetical protein [Planctomycetaceae bacterium]
MTRIALFGLMLLSSVGMTGCYSCNSCGMGCSTGWNNPCDVCSTCSGPVYGGSGCGSCSSCGPAGSPNAAMMPMSPQLMSQMASQQGAMLPPSAMANASYPNIVQEPQQAPGVVDPAYPAQPQGFALPAPPPQFQSLPNVASPMASPVTQTAYQQPVMADPNAMAAQDVFTMPSAPQYISRAQYPSLFPKKC